MGDNIKELELLNEIAKIDIFLEKCLVRQDLCEEDEVMDYLYQREDNLRREKRQLEKKLEELKNGK